jgi:hypothetical protein
MWLLATALFWPNGANPAITWCCTVQHRYLCAVITSRASASSVGVGMGSSLELSGPLMKSQVAFNYPDITKLGGEGAVV